MPADTGVPATLTANEAQAIRSKVPDGGARTIRVCMVSYHFSPDYSGSAVQARNLSRHLKALGVDAVVVSANLSRSRSHEVVDGLPVYRLPVVRNRDLRIPSFWIALVWFLLRHRREFDVIHAHGTLQHGSASIAGVLTGRPTVLKVAMADSDIAFERQGRLLGRVNRFLVSRFDRYIATTSAIADEFAAQGLDTSRVRRIPNGVDTSVYAPLDAAARATLRRTLGMPDGPVVIYVGILNKRKNVDGVLRIWRSAVLGGAPGHLVLVGPNAEGDDFAAKLREYASQPELTGRVTLTGYRPNVSEYMQASDVFLFPSMQEGMPNVVLEAMACGLTPLVSSSAGLDAVVRDQVNGFSLAWDDEAGFARLLQDLLAAPDRTRAVGLEARRTVEAHFSLAAVAARYRHLYDEMLAPGGPR